MLGKYIFFAGVEKDKTKIFEVNDLLYTFVKNDSISKEIYYDKLLMLREKKFMFIPFNSDELVYFLVNAPIDNNKLIQDSVSPSLKTDLSQQLFNDKISEADVNYKKAYGLKVFGYQQENAKATLLNSAEKNAQGGLYHSARDDVNRARESNLISTDQYIKGIKEIDYREIVGGLDEHAQDMTMPENMNTFRNMINQRTDINDKDKKSLIAKAELNLRNKQIGDFSNALEVTEKEQGYKNYY